LVHGHGKVKEREGTEAFVSYYQRCINGYEQDFRDEAVFSIPDSGFPVITY